MIDAFIILKNTKKVKSEEPDYRISANIGTMEQPVYRDIAGGWIKDGEKGKYIFAKFSKPFGDRKAYQITEVPTEKSADVQLDEMAGRESDDSIPF